MAAPLQYEAVSTANAGNVHLKVLVTGAAGFIGMHVAERLLARGDRVLGLDNLNDYYDVSLKQARLARLAPNRGFQFVKLDVADRGGIADLFERERPERVVHLAAQAGVRYSLKNPHVYADSHLYGLPATGLRFFTVYGPWGRPDMALFLFTKAILEGRPIDVFNQGKMQRDFTYIDDVVEAVVRILDRAPQRDPDFKPDAPDPAASWAPYRIYNIGNHQPVNLMTYIETLEKALGKTANKNFMPLQDGDVASTFADTDDIRSFTGLSRGTGAITERSTGPWEACQGRSSFWRAAGRC